MEWKKHPLNAIMPLCYKGLKAHKCIILFNRMTFIFFYVLNLPSCIIVSPWPAFENTRSLFLGLRSWDTTWTYVILLLIYVLPNKLQSWSKAECHLLWGLIINFVPPLAGVQLCDSIMACVRQMSGSPWICTRQITVAHSWGRDQGSFISTTP